MAVIRRKSLLFVVNYWVIIWRLARSVNGGQLHIVGDDHGWSWEPSETPTPYNFQDWADNQTFTVHDALNFGVFYPDFQVKQVSWENEKTCNASDAETISRNSNYIVIYNFTNSGQFGFICSFGNYCNAGMKFTQTVSDNVPVPAPQSESPGYESTPPSSHDRDGPPNRIPEEETHRNKAVVGVLVGAAALLLLAAIIIIIVMWKTRYWQRLRKPSGRRVVGMSYTSSSPSSQTKEEVVDMEWPWGPQRFSYKELKGATKSFSSSQVVGEGGFGTVYKGFLRDSPGTPVAVKRLSQYARQGAREFMAEVNIISQLRHRNLVQLLGWCDDNEELILVYEYMPNGDLDDLIFGSYRDEGQEWIPLPWKHRYNIFCGVATALVYLHEEWEQRVVHRDVKTSNVMLDSQFNARLGDFGLARLSAHSQVPRTTLVAGTIGYLAPEFNLTGRATDKTDVYAFGVVILEVSCARRPLTSNCILVDWVWELHKEQKLVDAIDPKLDVKSIRDEEGMKRALQVGLLCCHPDPSARPTMRHVLNILTSETPLPKMPRSKPVAFFAELG